MKSAEIREGVATAEQLQGKELSYNNINDTDAAFECVAEFAGRDAACGHSARQGHLGGRGRNAQDRERP